VLQLHPHIGSRSLAFKKKSIFCYGNMVREREREREKERQRERDRERERERDQLLYKF
jgi:hypothetical protein